MADTSTDNSDETKSASRWPLLGFGGAVSLCCLFTAPAATGAVGGTVAGGATTALGGGVIQVLVSAVAIGSLGLAIRLWTGMQSGSE
jgi:hypothetical protein